MRVIRGFPNEGVVAVFDEPNELGDIEDFDAPRNAPAKYPHLNLPLVTWHSEFFQYELQTSVHTVTVTHPSVPAKVQIFGGNPPQVPQMRLIGDAVNTSHTLVTHNLGYAPLAFVVQNGVTVICGRPVQFVAANGLRRTVSSFSNPSIIGLRETGISGISGTNGVALPSVSVTYQVLVFAAPDQNPSLPLFSQDGNGVILGRGKVNTSNLYARRVALGETPFSLDLGRTSDISNGSVRTVSGGATWSDQSYNGSFTGEGFVQIGY